MGVRLASACCEHRTGRWAVGGRAPLSMQPGLSLFLFATVHAFCGWAAAAGHNSRYLFCSNPSGWWRACRLLLLHASGWRWRDWQDSLACLLLLSGRSAFMPGGSWILQQQLRYALRTLQARRTAPAVRRGVIRCCGGGTGSLWRCSAAFFMAGCGSAAKASRAPSSPALPYAFPSRHYHSL